MDASMKPSTPPPLLYTFIILLFRMQLCNVTAWLDKSWVEPLSKHTVSTFEKIYKYFMSVSLIHGYIVFILYHQQRSPPTYHVSHTFQKRSSHVIGCWTLHWTWTTLCTGNGNTLWPPLFCISSLHVSISLQCLLLNVFFSIGELYNVSCSTDKLSCTFDRTAFNPCTVTVRARTIAWEVDSDSYQVDLWNTGMFNSIVNAQDKIQPIHPAICGISNICIDLLWFVSS